MAIFGAPSSTPGGDSVEEWSLQYLPNLIIYEFSDKKFYQLVPFVESDLYFYNLIEVFLFTYLRFYICSMTSFCDA